MKRTLLELARTSGSRLVGDQNIEISGVASPTSAKPGDLVFAEHSKDLPRALQSRASAVVAGAFAEAADAKKPLLIAGQPRTAFARAAAMLVEPASVASGIHPTAVIDPSAEIGDHVAIGPHVVIGAKAVISNHCSIASGVCVGASVRLGEHCLLYPNVVLYPRTTLGNRVIVHAGAVLGSDGFGYVCDPATGRYEKFPQIGTLEIGDDVEIGANVTIDRGALDATVIERGVKIDNLVHVAHNVRLGENVAIAAQTGISGSASIGRNSVLGGQVGIADHAHVGEGVILGAKSGVAPYKKLEGKGMAFWGSVARPLRVVLKEMAILERLAKERSERRS